MSQTRELSVQENRIIIGLLSIITVIAVGFVLYQIRSIVLPFALAVFISFIINPVIQFFEDRRMPTFLAISLALIITFLILNLFGMIVYTSIRSFAVDFPKYSARLTEFVQNAMGFFNLPPEMMDGTFDEGEKFQLLASIRELSLHRIILQTLGSMLTFVSNSLLVLLFLLFILAGRNQLVAKVRVAFADDTAGRIAEMLKNVNHQIQRYLITKGFISLGTGIIFGVVLALFGVEFAIIWGLLAFLLNFIPNIGSVIATILPLLIAFIQFESFTPLIWLVIILVSVQFVVGNLIDPRVVGHSLNLSPLVVLFSLMIWGWLWGIIGMFLAVPIAVIIKIIFENSRSLHFLNVLMSQSSAQASS